MRKSSDSTTARNCSTKDNSEQLKEWTTQELIDSVTDEQAKTFHETKTTLWAVVIKPWILIQATNQ
jgi:hypothetical protein